jgi:hypothetical protein
MGGVRVDPGPEERAGGRLADILGSLPAGAGASGNVWAWQFELENPSR